MSRIIEQSCPDAPLVHSPERPVAGWIALALCMLPALAATWLMPWFVTQDGPAHVYNAHVLNATRTGSTAFRDVYQVRWQPLPNWAGHLLAMGLDAALPPWAAERMLTTITLVGLAASCFWLRLSLRGTGGSLIAAALSVLIALNVTWLLGFTSFLLGTMMFALTLTYWWQRQNDAGPRTALVLGLLLVVGYFCHPISLGLTVLALAVLTLVPAAARGPRLLRLALAMSPLVPLGLCYVALTRQGGAMQPSWSLLGNPLSLSAWKSQLGWVDPITLSGKQFAPFVTRTSPWFALLTPAHWLILGLACLMIAGRKTLSARMSPWAGLGLFLIGAGIVAPDTLGINHGHYLPQRIVLLGLIALLPAIELTRCGPLARFGKVAILGALAMQTLWVWDYARDCNQVATDFVSAREAIGRNQRVGTVLADTRNRFRSNPLLHLDCLFGVDTGNIIWSNYETGYYYFPVQLRREQGFPSAMAFESVARLVAPDEAAQRAQLWTQLLDQHGDRIDVVVSYGHDPLLEQINAKRYGLCTSPGPGTVRVWSQPISSSIGNRKLHLSRGSEPTAQVR